ncbi:DUF2171 domain-containing protein [Roseomonas marmotae]|uniref:DUF2171 domain-containing protein n=1 Tax=Roseomonas marmotae TaxID=2768161 RepID=A0ABS3KA60_9PROT|nr:DUF2171 domain-containing protein [Roseomonas marmotae]MBO1074336.1 DUF2171 domain-containing protein [Roseomonas marmotae]QTI78088.1 DUF2171 domain-containing protein [Roseomonas marmotae]
MADATRIEKGEIQDHMPVVGSDGQPFGTVDHLAGDYIKLSRNDPQANGQHHYVPLSTVTGLDGGVVRLSMDPDEAARFGQPRDDEPHGSRAKARGAIGERQHGTSGQAPGPGGRLSFGARNVGSGTSS